MASRRRAQSKEVDLEEKVASGNDGAYEALQLYRSRAIRLKTKNEITASMSALAQGAKCLLKHTYENAGAELAMLLIDFLLEIGGDVTPSQVDMVLEVAQQYSSESTHKADFLKAAVKWSIKAGTSELGEVRLQVALGQALWTTDQRTAIYHLAAGESPTELNKLIQKSYPGPEQRSSKDRALTVGVLTFLSFENLRDANELLSLYREALISKDSVYVTETELESFCRYLLITCQRDAQPLFKILVNKYATALDFDETVPALLTGPIGLKFFNIKPKVQANPMMSMLQQMLSK
jgi:hypothetical protein